MNCKIKNVLNFVFIDYFYSFLNLLIEKIIELEVEFSY